MSSRRDAQSKADKLAELRRARAGGKRTWEDKGDNDLYYEVSEEQYHSIVKGRLQRDDFIVDDGADGYVDNGMEEDWGAQQESDDDSEEERRRRKAKKKGKETATKAKKARAKSPVVEETDISAYRPVVSAEQEEEFLAGILGELDAPAIETPQSSSFSRARKRKPSFDYESSSPPPQARNAPFRYQDDVSSDGFDLPGSDGFDPEAMLMSPKKKLKTNGAVHTPITPAIQKMATMDVQSDASFDDIDMDAFNDFSDVDDKELKPKVKKEEKDEITPLFKLQPKSVKTEPDKPGWLSVYDQLSVAPSESFGPSAKGSSSTLPASKISALEPDGSLRFFWLDYLENDGVVYFVGKLKDKNTGTWVSCTVTVEGIQRNVFVLPRKRMVEENEEGELAETDQEPTKDDVFQDLELMRKQLKIKSFRSKFVTRKYAFGIEEVPRGEAEYVKVVYDFSEKEIPDNACSPSILRIFGTNTSAFELLVLKRQIKGPCWLQIKNPVIDNKGVSWCKIEATVTDPKDIRPFADTDHEAPREVPPLTVMSLSVRSVMNHKENNREIVCCTARLWQNLNLDDTTPPEKLPCTVNTFVRPLGQFPPKFEETARANGKGCISPMTNERMLLNSLLMTIYKADPDVIVGHEFLGVSLDILLHRMKVLKADHWSRIGRFRRQKWPNIGRQGTNLRFLNGRLLCDLSSDGAKSMIASTTWSLTEMCATHLKNERQDIDPDDTASYFDAAVSTPERLMTFVRHCELDAHYQMAIASEVQIMQLTKQLTTIAGNSWNKTLNGGRAERNEYILLHEFHRLKYICPDKQWGKKHQNLVKLESQENDPEAAKATTAGKGRRDKYKGGLVFEPKRGLWDKFILVMDFNSLYPSIIQEYNIDFTTVESGEVITEGGEEKIPDPPGAEAAEGVLPRLIATLVNQRREVKRLMVQKGASPAKVSQWNIKQQALKLTANSMYGCLGFEYSRFFARPLAALTTFKGREILTHTRELAETLGLDVIYGDTDSVFVNSGVTDLAEALKISAEFKKAVNNQYKLLEIDLDGVFARLLLLQKKKYAAIKVEKENRTSTEIKGLDMKRREYCALSKNVSQYVLEQILSGEAAEVVVDNIHEYLSTISQNVRDGQVKVDDFIVYKRLGKDPEAYPDAKSQPHVQVALRMKARGSSARNGDIIPYIFCLAEGDETAKSAQADRAKHPDELRKAGSELKIDYTHYLANQVLPPIERLCEPIEGTDRSRLAECLGLDPSRYRISSSTNEFDEQAFAMLDSQMPDKEKFRDAKVFVVKCPKCQTQRAWEPMNIRDENSMLLASGPACPTCQAPLRFPPLQAQLERQAREHIGRYYERWTICLDATCGYRSRQQSVYGRRCLRGGCTSQVKLEYSDTELYNQLRYFAYLFDPAKAVKAAQGTSRLEEVTMLVEQNSDFLETMLGSAEKYLEQCARRWIDLGGIFGGMNELKLS